MTPSGRNRRRDFYVAFWASEKEYSALKQAAEEEEVSMSELLRRLIERECSNSHSDSEKSE